VATGILSMVSFPPLSLPYSAVGRGARGEGKQVIPIRTYAVEFVYPVFIKRGSLREKPPQKPRFPLSPEEKGARGMRANA